ncbi:MAG: helix-turn-helix transcriptional regulator, partial [Clostridia bacterium]|nr:helix-turn-helix transcriptional regulator [Clostridia bacterium]
LVPLFKALADTERCAKEPLEAMTNFYRVCHELFSRLEYTQSAPIDQAILLAIEYINKNYNRRISVPELAQMCNMSQSRFFTTFKAATGKTPIDYKNSVLVNRASQLLVSQSDRSIEQISDLLGFESSTYFRRLFKSVTGKTPREYRNTMKSGM